MEDDDLMLLGVWANPFLRRVQMALAWKGVDYVYREDDLMNKSPLLLKLNPVHKKVPVLVHHGKPIAESLVIVEYIDDKWPGNPLLPVDPYDRAVAWFWARYIDDKCNLAVWKALWSPPGEGMEEACKEAYGVLEKLEALLKEEGNKFFGGDSIGYVDIAANFLSHWCVLIGEEVTGVRILTEGRFPVLCEWAKNFRDSSFGAAHLPDKEKLVSIFEAMLTAKSVPYV